MSDQRMTHAQRRKRRHQIANAIKAGMTFAAACDRFECSYSYASSACKEFGVKTKSRDRRPVKYADKNAGKLVPTKKVQIIARILNSSEPYSIIAREFGLTRARVEQIANECRAAGIKFPKRARGAVRNLTDDGGNAGESSTRRLRA
jgi:hypothetical protein